MPLCIGLTGGIGSGKSKAADLFARRGAGVVDTDAISHALTGPGGGAMPEIERLFGREFVRADGALDRPRMREAVFGDPALKRRLEGVLHPMIRAQVMQEIQAFDAASNAAAAAPYVLLVVPLLLETGAYRELISRVLVIDVPEALQIERVMARSQLTEEAVRRIMAAQLPRAERVARADDVISNDGDINALAAQVDAMHRTYLAAARNSA